MIVTTIFSEEVHCFVASPLLPNAAGATNDVLAAVVHYLLQHEATVDHPDPSTVTIYSSVE